MTWRHTAAALLLAVVVASCDGGGTTAAPTSAASSTEPSEHAASMDAPAGTPAEPQVEDLTAVPVPRTEVTGAAWAGGVVVLGGIDEDRRASGAVHLWEPGTGDWRELAALPEPLHHTTAVVLDGALWVLGGYEQVDGVWRPTAAVRVLDAPDGAWADGPPLPAPRGAHAAASLTDGRVVVTGGVDADGATLDTTVVLEDGQWREGPSLPAPTEHLAAAPAPDVAGGVVVVGGRDGALPSSRDTAVLVDLDGDSVTELPAMNAARSGLGAAVVDRRVCVVGGEVPTGTVAEVECRTDGGWQVVARDPTPRHGLAVVALDGRLHTVAGGPEPGFTFSAVHWSLVP